jgi:TPR repeat protein
MDIWMARADKVEEYRQQAAGGDPDAMYRLAWEYFRGEFVPEDVGAAIAQLRQWEGTNPELARFNIAKMKYAEGDNSFIDDIRADCAAGFGPSLYLMGVHSLNRVEGEAGQAHAIEYFGAAAQNGHLPSQFFVWKLSKLGLWQRLATAIPALRAALATAVAAWRNENNERTLT